MIKDWNELGRATNLSAICIIAWKVRTNESFKFQPIDDDGLTVPNISRLCTDITSIDWLLYNAGIEQRVEN